MAIKLFDKTKKLSSYEMKHFYREATVLQRVQSVHCAAAYQFLDADFVYALVFELIKTDLLDDVTTNGPYSEDKVRLAQICLTLYHAYMSVVLVLWDAREPLGYDNVAGVMYLSFMCIMRSLYRTGTHHHPASGVGN